MSNQQLSQICERLCSRYPAVVAEVMLANPVLDPLDLPSLRHEYLNRLGYKILSGGSLGPQIIVEEQPPKRKAPRNERATVFEDILWEYATSLHQNHGEILYKNQYEIRDEVRGLVGTEERERHFQDTIDQIGEGEYVVREGKEESLKIKLRAYCRLDGMKPAFYPMKGNMGVFVLLEYIAAQPGAKNYTTLGNMWGSFSAKTRSGRGTSLETVLENGERYLGVTREYASILFEPCTNQAKYVEDFLSQLPIPKDGEKTEKDHLDPEAVFGNNFGRMRYKDSLNRDIFKKALSSYLSQLEKDHLVEVVRGEIRVLPGKQSKFNTFMLKRLPVK